MRKSITTAFGAAALFLAFPSQAEQEANFSGTLTGQYGYAILSGAPDANIVGTAGEGEFALGAGIHAQVNAGYNHVSQSGLHAYDWNVGGSPYWKGDMGRAGVIVNYTKVDIAGLGIHTTNFGGFGEYFANDMFTFGLKAGGYGGTLSGAYFGAAMTGYVFPNFAVSGGINYTHLDNAGAETALSVQGEYLLSEETPIAVFAGYTYSDLSNAGGHVSTFLMGLRFYFNTDGFSSLTERQRSGTVGTIGNFGAVGLNL